MVAVRVDVRGYRARGVETTRSLDGGAAIEKETQSCRHCQGILVIGTKEIAGYCPHCNAVLCEACERKRLTASSAKEGCRPFSEVIEASFRRQALLRASGL